MHVFVKAYGRANGRDLEDRLMQHLYRCALEIFPQEKSLLWKEELQCVRLYLQGYLLQHPMVWKRKTRQINQATWTQIEHPSLGRGRRVMMAKLWVIRW